MHLGLEINISLVERKPDLRFLTGKGSDKPAQLNRQC